MIVNFKTLNEKINIHFVFFFLLFIISNNMLIYAQKDITMEETIKYINGELKGGCTVDVVKGSLLFECKENGKVMRGDKVMIDDLDVQSIKYQDDEKAIIVKCNENSEGCILRHQTEYTVNNRKNYFNRINFLIDPDPKTVKGMIRAITHMMRLVQERKYHSSQPFEE